MTCSSLSSHSKKGLRPGLTAQALGKQLRKYSGQRRWTHWLELRQQAQAAGSRLQQAHVAVAWVLHLLPSCYPKVMLEALLDARDVFLAYGQCEYVRIADVGIAQVRCEIGEEQRAIEIVHGVLAEPSSLSGDALAAALFVLALANVRSGRPEVALRLIDQRGLEAAALAAEHNPVIQCRMLTMRAVSLLELWVSRAHREIWVGPPGFLHPPSVAGDLVPDFAVVQAACEAAREAMPPGFPCHYLDICLRSAQAVNGESRDVFAAFDSLQSLAALYAASDPHMSCWCYVKCMLLSVKHPVGAAAVSAAERGRRIATEHGFDGLLRDLVLLDGRVRESIGDAKQALEAYKLAKALRVRSMVGLQDRLDADALIERAAGLQAAPMRDLEPALLRRAVRYMEDHIREPITVQDVVDHVRVSRRTLEQAFKSARGVTIAFFIREAKLRLAAQALLERGTSVGDVAKDFGVSTSAFTSQFIKHFGATPARWARKARDTGGTHSLS